MGDPPYGVQLHFPTCPVPQAALLFRGKETTSSRSQTHLSQHGILIPQADLAQVHGLAQILAAVPSYLILKRPPRTPGGHANQGAEAPGGEAACWTDGPRPVAFNPRTLGPSPSGWSEGRCGVLFCTPPPLFLAEERLVAETH